MNEKMKDDLKYLIDAINDRYSDFDMRDVLCFSIGFLKDYPELVQLLEFIEERAD